MSLAFTIYNGASIEVEAHATDDGPTPGPGYFSMNVTEVDGTEVEITVHFDSAEGFAAAKQLAYIAKAINAKEPA